VRGFGYQFMNQMHFHFGSMPIEGVLAFGVEMELQQLIFLAVDDDVILIIFEIHLNGVAVIHQ